MFEKRRPRYPGNPNFKGESSHEDNGESEQNSRGKYSGWAPANTGAVQARFSESSQAGREFGKQIAKSKTQSKTTQSKTQSKTTPSKNEAYCEEPQNDTDKPWVAIIVLVILLAILGLYSTYSTEVQSAQIDEEKSKLVVKRAT